MESPQATEEVLDHHHEPVKIVVNGRPKEVSKKELSFKEVVDLAYNNNAPHGPNVVITVTYSKGVDGAQGSLLAGQSVKVKAGMVFNVKATDKS